MRAGTFVRGRFINVESVVFYSADFTLFSTHHLHFVLQLLPSYSECTKASRIPTSKFNYYPVSFHSKKSRGWDVFWQATVPKASKKKSIRFIAINLCKKPPFFDFWRLVNSLIQPSDSDINTKRIFHFFPSFFSSSIYKNSWSRSHSHTHTHTQI